MRILSEKVLLARQFAHDAHDSIGQKRKYSGEEYWRHVDRVTEMVAEYTDDNEIICSSELHDTQEDVFPVNSYYSLVKISELFGSRVSSFVDDLTNRFTHQAYPTINQKGRHQLERKRMANIQKESKIIKLCDVFDNIQDIALNDPKYAKIYLHSKSLDLPLLLVEGYNDELYKRVSDKLNELRNV